MERKPVDKRRFYTKEEKEYILSKTGGRCAHCGKKLTIKTMEKDHSIPWSKGGPSDVENIVPLCRECNKEKADRVLEPIYYMKYLKKSYLKEMQDFFKTYLKDVEFVNISNFFSRDEYSLSISIPFSCGNRSKLKNITRNQKYYKATYKDLDDIYYFLLDYSNSYNILGTLGEYPNMNIMNYIKTVLTDCFQYGVIMISRDSSNKISVVMLMNCMPDVIVDENGDCSFLEEDTVVTMPNVSVFMFLRQDISTSPAYIEGDMGYNLDNTRFFYYGGGIFLMLMNLARSIMNKDDCLCQIAILGNSQDRRVGELINLVKNSYRAYSKYENLPGVDIYGNYFSFLHISPRNDKENRVSVNSEYMNKCFINGLEQLYSIAKGTSRYKQLLEKYDGYTIKCVTDLIKEYDLDSSTFYNLLMSGEDNFIRYIKEKNKIGEGTF